MNRLTTIIQRQWLAAIATGEKRIEYRAIKPYWTTRLAKVAVPFELRLINGMNARAPEVTVRVKKVRRNTRAGQYELHIGKVLSVKYRNTLLRSPR